MILPTGVKKTNRSTAGFTLIELSVVVLILSIIVVAAVPRFRSTYETIKFRNTVYNIVKLMYYARDRAIIERKPYRVRFFKDDPAAYCLETLKEPEKEEENKSSRRSSRNRDKEPEFEELQGSIGRKMFFPQDIELDIDEPDKEDYVTFYPDGQSDECVIYITGANDETYTITTKQSVGLVKLYKEKKRM
ncbi:MAG: prepilin-type N-terminal cleavage/methylation domain-containing protein [Candidatus Auribacterota bacterium]